MIDRYLVKKYDQFEVNGYHNVKSGFNNYHGDNQYIPLCLCSKKA